MESARVGYLGPEGSFSHEAVTTLSGAQPVAYPSLEELLGAVADGSLDQGLVPLENALAQVRVFLHSKGLVSAETTSTSQAARDVAESDEPWAAVGSALAGELFGLDVIAADVEDHPDNATRFVLVGRETVAAPTGHDRTTIVCFQDADRPGSLYAFLGRFAARDINLTKLESRPTKRGLGDYCFVIEFEGHVADEVVADCLTDLQAHLARVKFLGSYPVTGEGANSRREEVGESRLAAAKWMDAIRARVRPS